MENYSTFKKYSRRETPLPTIPAGTRYRCCFWKMSDLDETTSQPYSNLVSFGILSHKDEDYILAETSDYEGKYFYMFRLCDIEKLQDEDTVTTVTKTITYQQAQEIIDIACSTWKDTLFEKWGKDIILKRSIEISQEFYDQMRKACTTPQHKLFDEIFDKDKPEYKVGDWVVITDFGEAHKPSSFRFNKPYKLVEDLNYKNGFIVEKDDNNQYRNGYDNAFKLNMKFRLATPKEIEAAKFPSKGTPCLVRDTNIASWKLAYSNGDGKFTSTTMDKIIAVWEQYQILDINNLPTQ